MNDLLKDLAFDNESGSTTTSLPRKVMLDNSSSSSSDDSELNEPGSVVCETTQPTPNTSTQSIGNMSLQKSTIIQKDTIKMNYPQEQFISALPPNQAFILPPIQQINTNALQDIQFYHFDDAGKNNYKMRFHC